tara:strand:+ start:440 stop:985 length:546 start_codon:yes stop_codon:yes gene_type:complete
MNYVKDISDSYVIDRSFQVPSDENGRIRLKTYENGTPLFIQDTIAKNERTNYSNATTHMLTPSLLSRTFFSVENIDIIQNAIRAEIYQKTNKTHIIDKQNYDQLKMIMRSIYLQYGLHQDHNIKEQVVALNKMVLDFCIPQVYSELISYLKYKEDISSLPKPIERPVYFSNDKTVELNRFI